MKLDPVYLVAPKSRPKLVPARRAFLWVAAAAAGGIMLGTSASVAWWFARGPRRSVPPDAADRARWAAQLAASGDVEATREQMPAFLSIVIEAYGYGLATEAMWSMVAKLAKGVAQAAPSRIRSIEARALLTVLALPPAGESLTRYGDALRAALAD